MGWKRPMKSTKLEASPLGASYSGGKISRPSTYTKINTIVALQAKV